MATFELAFDLRSDPAPLAGSVDAELMFGRGVVTAIAGIGNDAFEHIADQRLHIGNDFRERVPAVRVAGQGHDVGDELAAGRMLCWSGDADLDAELVGLVGLALADALDLWRMQRIDLASALIAILSQDAARQVQLASKELLQSVVVSNLPPISRITRPR